MLSLGYKNKKYEEFCSPKCLIINYVASSYSLLSITFTLNSQML